MERIDIIIPVYNGMEYLESLFGSVFRDKTVPYRLIIVDDCSPDEKIWPFLRKVKKENPKERIVLKRNESNLGFVKTVNKAVKLVKGNFVLLNTDVEVPVGWLERLQVPFSLDEKVASATPFTNSATICSFPNFLEDNSIFEDLSVDKVDSYFKRVKAEGNYFELPTGVGFCMMFKKRVVDEIGMFDEESFGRGYGEENDWCQRAIKRGYKNVIIPNLFVYHKHGGSFETEEKKKLVENNMKELLRKHPNYLKDVDNFIKSDPYRKIREFLIVLISSNFESGNKPILFFDHELGGGANVYREKYIEECLERGEKIFLFTFDFAKKEFLLRYFFKGFEFSYLVDKLEDFLNLTSFVKFKKIIVSQLVSFEHPLKMLEFIKEIRNKNGSELELLIHDYFSVCPNYVLIDDKNRYCNIPESKRCVECLSNNSGEYRKYTKGKDIESWRDKWNSFMSEVDKVICFSNSSKEIIEKVYGNALEKKVSVIPHKVRDMEYIYDSKREKSECLTIGVLGSISFTKGALIIKEMVSLIEQQNLKCKIVVIGPLISKVKSKSLVVTGTYKREEIKDKVLRSGIDVFFIPSIWPETFSYTSEEIMKMGYPLAVFDIGAPVERVKLYNKGLVISKVDAKVALSEICQMKL